MNPLDWPGPQFLVFYFALCAAVLFFASRVRRGLEDGPIPHFPHVDPYLIAYLRGGAPEAIRAATFSLVDRGLLAANHATLERTRLADTTEVQRPLERAILSALADWARPVEASSLLERRDVVQAAALYKAELIRQRLMPGRAQGAIRMAIAAFATTILLGTTILKLDVALARGRHNVGLLVVATLAALVWLGQLTLRGRRTHLGDRVIEDLQGLFSGLRARTAAVASGGATTELALLLGIFGMAGLSGALKAQTAQLFPRAAARDGAAASASCGSTCGSTSASCGSSSSCGGGGGGCGGCGGS